MTDTTTEMLALLDETPEQLEARERFNAPRHYATGELFKDYDGEQMRMAFIEGARWQKNLASQPSSYEAGQRSMQERAKAAQPGTAANPFQSNYERGKFDGVMEYRRAIASLPLEAQESDGGVEGHAIPRTTSATTTRYPATEGEGNMVATARRTEEQPSTKTGQAGIKPGPSDTPTSGDAVREAITRTIVAWADDEEFELTIRQVYALAAALKPEAAPAGASPRRSSMTDDQIKYMVDRFLGWKLPEDFNPDGGISFKKMFNEHTLHPMKHEPMGTNLFDATQADAMVRYLIEGMPLPEAAPAGEVVDAGERISRLAADLVVSGWMATKNGIENAKKRAERKLLDFACDEIERHLARATPPAITEREKVRELRLLIDEYSPHESDWSFRKGVIHDLLTALDGGDNA